MSDYNTEYFINEMDRNVRIESCAHDLREAQEAYMADRGNDDLGRAVARAAEELDRALGRVPGTTR